MNERDSESRSSDSGLVSRGGTRRRPLAGCALFPSVDELGGGGASPIDATASDAPLSDVTVDARSEAAAGASLDEEGAGNAVHDCTSNHLDGAFVVAPGWTTGRKGGGVAVTSPAVCIDLGTPAQFQLSSLGVTAWIRVAGLPSSGASGYVVGRRSPLRREQLVRRAHRRSADLRSRARAERRHCARAVTPAVTPSGGGAASAGRSSWLVTLATPR